MSEFVAFLRFPILSLLTEEEEKENKEEILEDTERVLVAEGIECNSKISRFPEEKLKEILEEVRKIRKNGDGSEKAINIEEVSDQR
ncbi:MAG TPA: hypothetical protein VJR94_06765 [Candidatus Nitrosocosmicus sp.]|nr:hypothetical protein [Candidatus Nitrosocosmicus sp.]